MIDAAGAKFLAPQELQNAARAEYTVQFFRNAGDGVPTLFRYEDAHRVADLIEAVALSADTSAAYAEALEKQVAGLKKASRDGWTYALVFGVLALALVVRDVFW